MKIMKKIIFTAICIGFLQTGFFAGLHVIEKAENRMNSDKIRSISIEKNDDDKIEVYVLGKEIFEVESRNNISEMMKKAYSLADAKIGWIINICKEFIAAE